MERRFRVVFWGDSEGKRGRARKEYEETPLQPRERIKIDQVLAFMELVGFRAPGLRVETVRGRSTKLHELKITSFGAEHRFLAAFAPWNTLDGRPILVLLRYFKKKRPRLDHAEIEVAEGRAKGLCQEDA